MSRDRTNNGTPMLGANFLYVFKAAASGRGQRTADTPPKPSARRRAGLAVAELRARDDETLERQHHDGMRLDRPHATSGGAR